MSRLPDLPLRVVVESVTPEVDAGRFAAKATLGEPFEVGATVFADGHTLVHADLLHRREHGDRWSVVPMQPIGNDRFVATVPLTECGPVRYTVVGWPDEYGSWRRDLRAVLSAGADPGAIGRDGAALLDQAAARADELGCPTEADSLRVAATELRAGDVELVDDDALTAMMRRFGERRFAAGHPRELIAEVERERARFGAWYELFPRSCSPEPGRHGTLHDCADRLDYVASMGFDVVYLPPVHPIGRTSRKGPNNSVTSGSDDVGSPWAIGAEEGGHTAVHPALGTLDDFDALVARAHELGMEIAMDLAFQCSPDHPWVRDHPDWFRHRDDGSIRCAENPPKRYEDIYPLDFENDDWRSLWQELLEVTLFWVDRGVSIFRVDNPHTKPFRFWEWMIAEVRSRHPDVVFLAEAFTRPTVMYRLAKLGFSQSYTYFTWRHSADELRAYLEELAAPETRAVFRPNLWPNTPDILTDELRFGGRAASITRFVLAAALGPSYGVYGPTYELLDTRAREGAEEYLDNEKYQLRSWDLTAPGSLQPLIRRMNRIRREHAAFRSLATLRFHECDNDRLLCFSKLPEPSAGDGPVVVVVNLDPHHVQSGHVHLDLDALGVDPDETYQAHDLLGESHFLWSGPRNYVSLDPNTMPAHVLRIRRRTRTEHDFEYFA